MKNRLFFTFLILIFGLTLFASLPPTTTRVSGEGSDVVTFGINFGAIPATRSGTAMALGTIPIAAGGTGATTQNFVDLTTNQTIAGAKTFQATTSVGNLTVTGVSGGGYVVLPGQASNPVSPTAGSVLLHGKTNNGFTVLEADNETAANMVIGRDNVFIAKNTSGSPITLGQVVYVTGSTGSVPNVSLAKADSILTSRATIGIATETSVAANSFGQFMVAGILDGVNTSSFTSGDVLYVSTSSAGSFVSTRPEYPYFAKHLGIVLNSGVGNGSILVNVGPHTGNTDSGTNAASFSAAQLVSTIGTGTAPLAVTSTTRVANLYVDRAATADVASAFASMTSETLRNSLTDESGGGVAIFADQPYFTTSIFTPKITGGTTTTQALTYKTTTGVGTTGADHVFQVGSNGGTEAMRILNSGRVGVGITSPDANLDVKTKLEVGFPGLKVTDHSDTSGVIAQSINGVYRGVSSDSYYYNGGLYRSNNTYSSMIDMKEGSIKLSTNSGLTAGVDFSPTQRMIIDATGSVSIGTSIADASAVLDVTSTTKGFAPPRMTKAQKDAIASPVSGLEVYDTDLSKKSYYDNSAWFTIPKDANMLLNGDAEGSAAYGWTCTSGTCTKSTTAGEFSEGSASLKVALSAQAMNVSQSVNTPSGIQKKGIVGVIYKVPSAMADFNVCSLVDGAEQTCVSSSSTLALVLDNTYRSVQIPLTFGSTSAGIKFKTTAATTSTAFFDGAYLTQGPKLPGIYSAEISATGVVTNEKGYDWLAAGPFTPTSTNKFAITINSGIFNSTPHCFFSGIDVLSNEPSIIYDSAVTQSNVLLGVRTFSGASVVAHSFKVICFGE